MMRDLWLGLDLRQSVTHVPLWIRDCKISQNKVTFLRRRGLISNT